MKRTMQQLAVAMLGAAVIAGCATMGHGPSDEELITGTVADLKTALENADLDLLEATFSPNFAHPEIGDMEQARFMAEQAIAMGYADGIEVHTDRMQIDIREDGTATVYPIELVAMPGSVAIELVMEKVDGDWLVATANVDGI